MTLAVAASCGGASRSELSIDTSGGYRGTSLTSALPKPAFTLLDTSGAFFNLSTETEGYITLLYFGYTYCPDICPDHMATIAAGLKRLPEDSASRVKVVFVTVDPDRDTSARLREWLDLFSPSFVGLRGDAAAVDSAMKKTLGDLYFPATKEDLGNGNYSVGHAAFVIAYTPDNQAHVVYPSGLQQADWEHDLYKLARDGWVQPSPVVAEAAVTTVPPDSTGSPMGAPTPAGATIASATPAPQGRHRLSAAEATPLLGTGFTSTTLEAVKQAIALAFERHPDATRFTSQGLTLTREKIDLEVRICGSRPQGTTDSSLLACSTLGGCARLARILYDFYMQSGYSEFFDAAAAVYNYVGSALPNEAAAFTLVLRSELRLSGLPAN
ncbi:MAG TPA: SCO family protein [Dehalococcoidia bacterium]|nr:SCO family protein [Dehalococcoidia bacterium]